MNASTTPRWYPAFAYNSYSGQSAGACGDGRDFPAGDDPDAEKAALEASHCDPQVREPFIAALALASSLAASI